MTLQEVVDQVMMLKPHAYPAAQVVTWLSECDLEIYHKVIRNLVVHPVFSLSDIPYQAGDIMTYYGVPFVCIRDGVTQTPDEAPGDWQEESFPGYSTRNLDDVNESLAQELLVKSPYDRNLYIPFVSMKIDYYNRELPAYNREAMLYNAALDDYSRHMIRTYHPVRKVTHWRM